MFIYSLHCPITNNAMYVGKSISPKKRLKEHWRERFKLSTPKAKWLQSLSNKPKLYILQSCNNSNWVKFEKWWISYFNKKVKLTNVGNAGAGSRAYRKCSESTKKKHSQRMKAIHNDPIKSKKLYKRVSEGLKGKINPSFYKMQDYNRKNLKSKEFYKLLNKKVIEKCAKTYKIIKPTGEILIIKNLSKFCKENKLDCSSMNKLAKSATGVKYKTKGRNGKEYKTKQFTHKGYKCFYQMEEC